MRNGLKEGKALPAGEAKLSSLDNQFHTELPTLGPEFDLPVDGLEAELSELPRDLERDLGAGLDTEIPQLADALLGPVPLENAESVRGIYQGPDGATNFQQLLSSNSEQHEGAADAESPLPSPLTTLSTPPRIDALSQPADAEPGYGEDPSKSLPPTTSAMSNDGFHKRFVLQAQYNTRAIALKEAEDLYGDALRLCGPESRYPAPDQVLRLEADRDKLRREVDGLRNQIDALNQDTNGAASRPGPGGSPPRSPTPPGQSPSALGSGGPVTIPPFRNPPYSGGNNPTNPDQQNTTEPKTERQLRAPSPSSSPPREATPETAEDPTKPLPPLPPFSPGPDLNTYFDQQSLWNKCDVARSMVLLEMKNHDGLVISFGASHRFVAQSSEKLKQLQLEFTTLRRQLRQVLPDTLSPTAQPPGGSSPQ